MVQNISIQSIFAADKNSETPLIRIKVSNYVRSVNQEIFCIISKAEHERQGGVKVGLIGGGARLYTPIEQLSKFGAHEFETDDGSIYDAKFKIPLNELHNFINPYTGELFFSFETNPYRELQEELAQERPGGIVNTILTKEEVDQLKISDPVATFCYYEGESLSNIQRGTNLSIINLFMVDCSEEIYWKLKDSESIFTISLKNIKDGYIGTDWVKLNKSVIESYNHIINNLKKTPDNT